MYFLDAMDASAICDAIPDKISGLIGTIVNIIKIGVPIILIIMQ